MSTRLVPGQLIVLHAPLEVARKASTLVVAGLRSAIQARGRATVALSGGNTPLDTYAEIASTPVDWTCVGVFWVDERAVPPTGDRSNYRSAKARLLDPARVPPQAIHRMPAERPDLDAAAIEYERLLRTQGEAGDGKVPALDVVVLGVGDDGHTASLFPGDPAVAVVDRLVVAVPPTAGRNEARMTLTRPLLQAARSVFVLAVGEAKRQALERVWNVEGSIDVTPARLLRECRGAVTWVVDRAAAGLVE